jgi:cobalt-zinc-cadmium efflux system membrane fusion protein
MTVRSRRAANFPVATLAIALITIALVTGCSPSDNSAPASSASGNLVTLTADQLKHIRLYTVAPTEWRKTIDATGAVDFDNDHATSVLAPFSGPVSRLLVAPGARVVKGEPLAVVDSPDFAAAVDAYRKAVATAATLRRLADLDRDLVQHQGVSKREADQAETDAVSAEADRYAALQSLISLNIDPKNIDAIRAGQTLSHIEGVIRAPLAGTLVERLISPGQLLQAGSTPCFTIADVSRIWVLAQVFDSDIAAIRLGDHADVVTGNNSAPIPGTVTNIPALVDPDTRSVNVRVSVDNPAGLLRKQMYVRVRINSRAVNTGLLAPVSAILRDDENLPFVYVAESNGGFARRHITLGTRAGDYYDIPAGVKSGDRVVVDGGLFLQFMQSQ